MLNTVDYANEYGTTVRESGSGSGRRSKKRLMQAVLITPNGPDGSWCQGLDLQYLSTLFYLDHHDNPTRDKVARSTRPAVFLACPPRYAVPDRYGLSSPYHSTIV